MQNVVIALQGALFAGWIWEVLRLHRVLLSCARAQRGHPFPALGAMVFVWRGFFAGREVPQMRVRLIKISLLVCMANVVVLMAR
ncbi:hypothetical protein [Pseudogemmobacter sp. W21_MBD1_M6]|uniref:hypothetical protein n=1 Tax=Pseudogemmobacter sp. W21_MBD1_M6 TaxID=3240271 RepID=UPI003F98C0C8